MTGRIWCGCAAVLGMFVGTSAALADVIPLGGGWEAKTPDGGAVSIVVDTVGNDFLVIEIAKDFTEPPGVGGVFPPILIDFNQVAPDAGTVPRIIIADEAITNLTGVPWLDFHWALLNEGEAWFNVPLSASFSVDPYTNKTFSDPGNVFGDPNKATDLEADGGVVPAGSTFFPGGAPGDGALVMDIDLSREPPVSFTLKEFPTPEPGAFMLFALAALALRRRG